MTMLDERCAHKTDATGHCMEPTCRNYAFYTGERDRQAAIVMRDRASPPRAASDEEE